MTDVLARGPRARPLPGRFLHTGLTPHPIDLWALAQWNAGVRASIEAYDKAMAKEENGPTPRRYCHTPDCATKTNHHTGYCYYCRPKPSSYKPCEGDGCTTTTLHETGLCYYCRRDAKRAARAVNNWAVCKRCQGATRAPDRVCARCRDGRPSEDPSHHWSLRYLA